MNPLLWKFSPIDTNERSTGEKKKTLHEGLNENHSIKIMWWDMFLLFNTHKLFHNSKTVDHFYLNVEHAHAQTQMCFVAFYAYICRWSVYEWRSHVFKLHLWINEIIYLFKCKFKRDNKHRTWLRVFLLLLLPRFF